MDVINSSPESQSQILTPKTLRQINKARSPKARSPIKNKINLKSMDEAGENYSSYDENKENSSLSSNLKNGMNKSNGGKTLTHPSPLLELQRQDGLAYESPKMTRMNKIQGTHEQLAQLNENLFSLTSIEEIKNLLKRNFDDLDIKQTGYLDYRTIWVLLSQFPQINNIFEISDFISLFSFSDRLDSNSWKRGMISRLVGVFFNKVGETDRSSWTISFQSTLELFLLIKQMGKAFEDGENIPIYMAPNILQEIVPRNRHRFIASSVSRWLTNYYMERQIHQGLVGLTRKDIGVFPEKQSQLHGVSFFPVLEMVIDILEQPLEQQSQPM